MSEFDGDLDLNAATFMAFPGRSLRRLGEMLTAFFSFFAKKRPLFLGGGKTYTGFPKARYVKFSPTDKRRQIF